MSESIHEQLAALKAREAAEKSSAPKLITDAYTWGGQLEDIPPLVRNLIRFGKLTAESYDIKYVSLTRALRISDYNTYATCQPGEYFWMLGDAVCSGDLAEYQAQKAASSNA